MSATKALFVSLSIVASVVLFGFVTPAIAAHLSVDTCFEHPGTRHLALPAPLNDALCTFNAVFLAGWSAPAGRAMMRVFGAMFTAVAFIFVHHAFRPRAPRAQHAAPWFLAAGQIATMAVALPLYCAAAPLAPRPPPAPVHAWTALVAVAVGYLLPTLRAARAELEYKALAQWHIFPLYILALCAALPPLLCAIPALRARAPAAGASAAPVLLMALVASAVSAAAHAALVRDLAAGAVSLPALLQLPSAWPATPALQPHAQLVLTADLALTFILQTLMLLCGASGGPAALATRLAALAAGTLALGPGAALALLWAYQELTPAGDAPDKAAKAG